MVGLDLPMSEQVRQRQVTLNDGKTLVNTKGVYGSKFGNETHFLSFAAIVATRNGTGGSDSRKTPSGNVVKIAKIVSLVIMQTLFYGKHHFRRNGG